MSVLMKDTEMIAGLVASDAENISYDGGTVADALDNIIFENISQTLSVTANSSSSETTLTTGKNFIDYNMISIIGYDGTYIRCSSVLSRNPVRINFSAATLVGSYAGNIYASTFAQNSDTSFTITNGFPADLTFVIRGLKIG